MSFDIFVLALVLFNCVLLVKSVKHCPENQYLAIFRFDECVNLSGSGLVAIVPFIYSVVRIKQGDKGEMLSPGLAEINGKPIPVASMNDIPAGSTIKVVGIEGIPEACRNLLSRNRLKVEAYEAGWDVGSVSSLKPDGFSSELSAIEPAVADDIQQAPPEQKKTPIVNPGYIVALLLVFALVGVIKILNPHKKYSTQDYWQNATLESVAEIPDEALQPGNKNGPVLMWAAMATNNTRIIAALVDRGADINESDFIFRGTPLTGAAGYSKSPEIIDELVRLGADVHKQVHNREDALMIAAQYNHNPGIVERLVFHGADIHHKNSQGRTALALAVISNNAVVEKSLRRMLVSRQETGNQVAVDSKPLIDVPAENVKSITVIQQQ